jgi:hypothetical protein
MERLNPCEGSGSMRGGSWVNWDPCKHCGVRHRPELCPKAPWRGEDASPAFIEQQPAIPEALPSPPACTDPLHVP